LAAGERARRLLNVVVAALALVLVLPVMAVIALLIKTTTGGPVFFTQWRIGLDRRTGERRSENGRRQTDWGGRPFRIYKFRTMREGRGAPDAEVWAQPDDPRVTRLGRMLRQYRLDELPQFVNVLRGDMNVVGPRPEQPSLFAELRSQITGYGLRQQVAPGITGWAQINHHYDFSINDVRRKLAYDLEYLARRSVLEDVKIMVRTLPVVLFRRGAW
jgi:lipopolysaccharide/colanic/teichoic acid biosynthesis glycosyltransferase